MDWRVLVRPPTVAMRLWQVLALGVLHALAPLAAALVLMLPLALLLDDRAPEPYPYADAAWRWDWAYIPLALAGVVLAALAAWWLWSVYRLVRESLRRPRAAPTSYLWLLTAPGTLVLSIGTLAYLGRLDVESHAAPRPPPLPFESARWKDEPAARPRMLDDLLERTRFVSQPRESVVALLGGPDGQAPSGTYLEFRCGARDDFFAQELQLHFDASSQRCTSARLHYVGTDYVLR